MAINHAHVLPHTNNKRRRLSLRHLPKLVLSLLQIHHYLSTTQQHEKEVKKNTNP